MATLTAVIDMQGVKDLRTRIVEELHLRVGVWPRQDCDKVALSNCAIAAVELVLTAMKTASDPVTDTLLIGEKLAINTKLAEIDIAPAGSPEPRRIVHEFWEAVRAVVGRANSVVFA